MRKLTKIIIGLLLLIILVLSILLIANTSPMQSRGLIIKLKPLKFALIFSHGCYLRAGGCKCNYKYNGFEREDIIHMTEYKHKMIPTVDILYDLMAEGYDKIYVSMCQTRNYEEVYKDKYVSITWKEFEDMGIKIYKSRLLGGW